MPYLTNPIYLSGGFAGQTDAVTAFGQDFSDAFTALKAMPPADVAAVQARVIAVLNQMPAAERAQHLSLSAKVAQAVSAKGLGALGDPVSTAAAIIGSFAALASLSISVYGAFEAHKQAKAAQSAAATQQALVDKNLALQIQAQQQANAAAAPAPTVPGAPAAAKASSIPTLAATLVAGAGAYLLAR